MKISVSVLFCIVAYSVSSPLNENGRELVEPEYLDYLLKGKNYDELNRLLQIDVPHLSRPRAENDTIDPRYSPHLKHGDIVYTPEQKEQAREGLDLKTYSRYKWPNGVVSYYISGDYTPEETQKIRDCIAQFNKIFAGCIILREYRSGDENYAYMFSGNGCYSRLGCTGGQQPLSLSKSGCIYCSTIWHEILHALGFCHQHNRCDRDNFIKILWDNIKSDWKSQFEIADSRYFVKCGSYDCYSIMHYPLYHPDVCVGPGKNAFIPPSYCDGNAIGNGNQMTAEDIKKCKNLYCNQNQCTNYAKK